MDRALADLDRQEIELLPRRDTLQVAGFDFAPINFAGAVNGTATAAQVITINLRP
jgi:hypothetical protein